MKMENGECNGVGLGLDTCPLKDKTTAKTEKIAQEADKLRRKAINWGQGDAWSCVLGSTVVHQEPRVVVAPGRCSSDAFRTLRFVLFLVYGFFPWIIRLGHIGLLFATFLDLLGPQLHSFSYYLARYM